MTVSKEKYTHYWEKGWVVIEDVYAHDKVDRIVDLAMETGRKNMENQDNYAADRSDDSQELAVRKVDKPFLEDPLFQDFALDKQLISVITQLLGAKPKLATDQIFMKPPRFGSAKPYHQDNAYFCLEPEDHVITAWIALDDVDVENGCMRYIDGSHSGPLFPHEPIPGQEHNKGPLPEHIDLARESLAPVRKGGVVFHHVRTLHTSHRNESDRWRRAYATHWVTDDVTSGNATLSDAYYKLELPQRNH